MSRQRISATLAIEKGRIICADCGFALVESGRVRWLPVIQVKGVNLGSG